MLNISDDVFSATTDVYDTYFFGFSTNSTPAALIKLQKNSRSSFNPSDGDIYLGFVVVQQIGGVLSFVSDLLSFKPWFANRIVTDRVKDMQTQGDFIYDDVIINANKEIQNPTGTNIALEWSYEGINYNNLTSPHYIKTSFASQASGANQVIKFFRAAFDDKLDSSELVLNTTLDYNHYNNSGVLASVPAASYSIQALAVTEANGVAAGVVYYKPVVFYGNSAYTSFEEAIGDLINVKDTIDTTAISIPAKMLGFIIVNGAGDDLKFFLLKDIVSDASVGTFNEDIF